MTGDVLLVALFVLIKRAPLGILVPAMLVVGIFFEFASSLLPFLVFMFLFVSAGVSLWLFYAMHQNALTRIIATGVGLVLFDACVVIAFGIAENASFVRTALLFLGTACLHVLLLAVFEGIFAILYKLIYAIRRNKKTPRFLGARF